MSAIWPFLFWLVWGMWIATGDLQGDGVTPAVIKLFVGAFVLGLGRPNGWWIWALALSAWVPLEPVVAQVMNLEGAVRSTLIGTLLPPLPALAGGLLGRTFRHTL